MNFSFFFSRFFFIYRKIFKKVRQLRHDEKSAMNGKGLLGDSSTDPLAINSRTNSTDEVILTFFSFNSTEKFLSPFHANHNTEWPHEQTIRIDDLSKHLYFRIIKDKLLLNWLNNLPCNTIDHFHFGIQL